MPLLAPIQTVSWTLEQALADIPEWFESLLRGWGLGAATPVISRIVLVAAVVLAAVLLHFLARQVLVGLLHALVRRTRTRWDDALVDQKVFARLAHMVPALVLYFGAPLVFQQEEFLRALLERVSWAYLLLIGAMALTALLSAAVQIYDRAYRGARDLPILSTIQVVKIFVWIFAVILIIATLMDRSPWAFLGGLGAMTAVILLVFRDAILGFVASITITANDMLRVGDWIEMPQFQADGDVERISLATVKVRNWDKTVTTIPTYALISQAFKNWRGMSESGGRRIKRSLLIDLNSIRFVDAPLLARLRRIQYLQEYLDRKLEEVAAWNREHGADDSTLVNGRQLTNVGTFRAYLEAYLRHHPQIHQEGMTFLARQLAPTDKGLPLEIYVFSKEQRWVQYEGIQADIFDHLLAAAPEFGLRVVQTPTGADLQAALRAS